MPPEVSVVMAVYNGAARLRQAVECILTQTCDDLEFIVIDDGSTDDTSSILDTYTDPRIVRLKNDTNLGLTHSLNKGLATATGEFIARQDCDDYSYPSRLTKQVTHLNANHYADKSLQADREVVLAAVKENGYALGNASEELQQDEELKRIANQ